MRGKLSNSYNAPRGSPAGATRVAAEVLSELNQKIRVKGGRQDLLMAELIRETLQDEFGDRDPKRNDSGGS